MSVPTLFASRSSALIGLFGISAIALFFYLFHQQAAAFEPYSYNELRKEENGVITSEIHGKFINYLDDNDQWQKIDLSFVEQEDGFHLMTAPYELHAGKLSTDEIRFVSTNTYDVKNKKVRNDAPYGKNRRFPTVTSVEGKIVDQGILYANALPQIGADLLLQPHEMEARYLVVWKEAPRCEGTMEIPFAETYDYGTPRMRDGTPIGEKEVILEGGFAIGPNDFRGIGTPQGKIWDSSGKGEYITIQGSFKDGVFSGKKVIDCSFFNEVTYPVFTDDTSTFYPDPDPETSTFDDTVINSKAGGTNQETWDEWHDATTGTVVPTDEANHLARSGYWGGGYLGARGFLLFDTSSIPNDAILNSAKVQVYITYTENSDNDGDDFIVFVSGANPASNTSLSTADFDQCGSVNSPTEIGTRFDITSATTSSYNDLHITTLSEINKTGITKLCAREGHDVLDSRIDGSMDSYNAIYVYFAERTGTSQDPKLVVTYTVPADAYVAVTGDSNAESGTTLIYNVTAGNNGTGAITNTYIYSTVPSGFSYNDGDSSPDCSLVSSQVRCGSFGLSNGSSTGRLIAFDVNVGTCDVSRTTTVTISGATLYDTITNNNSDAINADITCPTPVDFVRKSADQNISSSTTLQDDNELSLTLLSGRTYLVFGALFATSTNANPDIKIAFTTPQGATMDIGYLAASAGQFRDAELLETSGLASSRIDIQANMNTIMQLNGTIVVGTGGNLKLRWAQVTSNASATTLKQGSFLSVTEIQ